MNTGTESYDSGPDTLAHIQRVRNLITQCITDFEVRALHHDKSKLKSPEKEYFDTYTPLLKDLTYGSPEYHRTLKKMRPGVEHHYKMNDHHPEHFEKGVDDMNLLQIVEMLMDWKASSERYSNGDIYTSIDKNTERFHLSEQLRQIFINTAKYLGW